MHVLLIPYSYPNSYNRQSHVFFEEQAAALAKSGVSVGVIAVVAISLKHLWRQKKVDIGLAEENLNGIRVLRYQFPSLPKMPRFNSWLRLQIGKRLFLRYRNLYGSPDLAHVHVSLGGIVALWMQQHHNVPYVVTEHYTAFTEGIMPEWQVNSARRVFENSKLNFAVSNEFKGRLEHDYRMEFAYLPNLVDTNFFLPPPQREHRPIRHYLNIGNLYLQKNQEMLIRAFSQAFEEKKDFTLTIAGGGSEEYRLKKLVTELGMQDQISFFGRANRRQVAKLMQQSDCFVLSSRFETFGVVVIEAMSCGLPVIATKSGGPESIITDSRLGILCDIDEQQLYNALIEMSTTSHDRQYIRNHAVSNFSAEAIARQLTGFYTSIVNSQPNSPHH